MVTVGAVTVFVVDLYGAYDPWDVASNLFFISFIAIDYLLFFYLSQDR